MSFRFLDYFAFSSSYPNCSLFHGAVITPPNNNSQSVGTEEGKAEKFITITRSSTGDLSPLLKIGGGAIQIGSVSIINIIMRREGF